VLEIMAEALLISAGFGGAEADFKGGCTFGRSADGGLGFDASVFCLGLAVAAGDANASSANLSVTL
jgi:hypothetical protein